MRIKIFIVFCFIVSLLCNCDEKKGVRDILTTNCFWDVLNKGAIHPINSCFMFKDDGSCMFYYYNFFDRKRTDSVYKFDDGDVIVPNKWNVMNDSIQIRANKYHLIKYESDSVFLTATGVDTMVLIKNCSTINPRNK